MGSFEAGRWLLGLVIYFSVFLLVTTYVQNWNPSSIGESQTTGDADLDELISSGDNFCATPRYRIGGQTNMNYFIPVTIEFYRNCGLLPSRYSEDDCNDVVGCFYDNTTSFFDFTDEQCEGEINFSYYANNDSVDAEFVRELGDPCSLERVVNNKVNCQLLGCTWYDGVDVDYTDFKNPFTILDAVGNLFTFRYDYGFEGYDVLLNLIFFYFPFIVLLIAVYYAMPFIH